MKYGLAFALVAFACAWVAVSQRDAAYTLLWPALSFGLVAAAYFGLGPKVFGKRACGKLAALNIAMLLPYLSFTWLVWHLMRIVRREPPQNQLTPRVWIGRRLLPSELPAEAALVVDLTCEFSEPKAICDRVEYVSLPTLDGTPPHLPALFDLIRQLAVTDKMAYIHCAEGHGRTGVVAAALLMATGLAAGPQEAVEKVREIRPKVRLGKRQMRTLEQFYEQWLDDMPP